MSYTAHFQDMANTIPSAPINSFTYPIVGGGTVTNPNITFTDGTTVGTNINVPQETLIRKYQFSDVFSWTHGVHNMKMGANWIYFAKMGGYFYSGLGYFMTFWDNPTCIQSGVCPDADPPSLIISIRRAFRLRERMSEMSYATGSGSTAQPPWSSLGLFFQDDWKVSPRLTLNLGLRWDANIDFLQPQLGTNQSRTATGRSGICGRSCRTPTSQPAIRVRRPSRPSSATPATCNAPPPTGRSSNPASALPGTSPEPASICCAADTASLAIRSSRTSRCSVDSANAADHLPDGLRSADLRAAGNLHPAEPLPNQR